LGTPIKGTEDPSIDQLEPDPVGLLCKFVINKNKVAPPLRKGSFYLMFDERGIFHEATFANMLIERERHKLPESGFQKNGSWFSWKEESIGQGFRGLVKFFLENPDVMLEMEQEEKVSRQNCELITGSW
jgi:recombination protein RecA